MACAAVGGVGGDSDDAPHVDAAVRDNVCYRSSAGLSHLATSAAAA